MTEETAISLDRVLTLLAEGEIQLQGRFLWGSNYTFLVRVTDQELSLPAVYKPSAGERPLWDFDHATLCRREVAAYILSRHLGWPLIPPAVLRDGPHGPGSVQRYIESQHEEHYFSLRERGDLNRAFQEIALFDLLTNNADRKGGHCLLGLDGQIWAIDHGLTFHADPKLRTVIWDYAGLPIDPGWLQDLRALGPQLAAERPLGQSLAQCISLPEIEALRARLQRLVSKGVFPEPGPGRSLPYPLI